MIRPPDISSTWSDHGSRPAAAAPACTGRTPATRSPRSGRGAIPGSRSPAPGTSATMSSWSAQPELVGRHGPGGVLVQQRGERVHVVALERVDVARQQRALRSSSGPGGGGVARHRWRRQRRAGPLQRAVDRRDRRLEQLGDLVACQRSTSRRISTARWRGGRCWSAATKASRIDSRATATSAGSPSVGDDAVVGDGLDPGRSRERRRRAARRRCAAGLRSIGSARRWRLVEHVEADVGRDPVQPRAERRRGPRSGRARARPAPASPGPRPRPRRRSPASGSSSRSARYRWARRAVRSGRRAAPVARHARQSAQPWVGHATAASRSRHGTAGGFVPSRPTRVDNLHR